MASFFSLLAQRNRPVEAIFSATDVAEESRLHECHAATKIQSAARMRRHRRRFKFVRQCIVDMQRVYRGYRGRARALDCKNQLARARHLATCHYYAAVIQSRFRGYFSRKWISDFYAQKRYIMLVTERSEAVRREASEAHEQQRVETERASGAAMAEEYRQALAHKHHLLSTATVSGVYRPPLSVCGQATVFNTNIEDDLRALPVPRRKFKKDLPVSIALSSSSEGGDGTAMYDSAAATPPRRKPQHRRRPLAETCGPTLLASAPYDAAAEQRRLEAAINKKLADSLHSKAFVARKPQPPPPPPSLAIDAPYVSQTTIRTSKRQ